MITSESSISYVFILYSITLLPNLLVLSVSNSLGYDRVMTDPVIVMSSERVVTEETPRLSFIRTFSDFKLNNL